jgi:hypothetical protein
LITPISMTMFCASRNSQDEDEGKRCAPEVSDGLAWGKKSASLAGERGKTTAFASQIILVDSCSARNVESSAMNSAVVGSVWNCESHTGAKK